MHPIRNVLVCGAGAVGSSYLERLHDLDPALVGVLASGERRARLDRERVTVNGRLLPIRTVGSGDGGPPADVILVAVKQHHLAAAIEDLRPFVGAGTVVLSLLNGITSENVLAAAFGPERILHGFVVGNDVLREGSASRYTRIGRLVFGAARGTSHDERVVRLKALLDSADIPNTVPADIIREQWWKFMLNVGVKRRPRVSRSRPRTSRPSSRSSPRWRRTGRARCSRTSKPAARPKSRSSRVRSARVGAATESRPR
jgi:2-dehydropantoate 2-reductase